MCVCNDHRSSFMCVCLIIELDLLLYMEFSPVCDPMYRASSTCFPFQGGAVYLPGNCNKETVSYSIIYQLVYNITYELYHVSACFFFTLPACICMHEVFELKIYSSEGANENDHLVLLGYL